MTHTPTPTNSGATALAANPNKPFVPPIAPVQADVATIVLDPTNYNAKGLVDTFLANGYAVTLESALPATVRQHDPSRGPINFVACATKGTVTTWFTTCLGKRGTSHPNTFVTIDASTGKTRKTEMYCDMLEAIVANGATSKSTGQRSAAPKA